MPTGGTEAEQRAVEVMLAKQVFPRSNEALSWATEREADEADEAGLLITGMLAEDCCHVPSQAAGGGSRTNPAERVTEMPKQQNLLGPTPTSAGLTLRHLTFTQVSVFLNIV